MALSSDFLQALWKLLDFQSLFIFLLAFLLVGDYIKHRRPKSFPPAPPGLPFFGNMFSFNFKRAHIDLTQLAVHYGDVYSLRIGQSWIVILNSYKTIKEALVTQGESTIGKKVGPISTKVGQHLGLVGSNGFLWKQQRRFSVSTLKYFGVGKKSLESAILEEFTYLEKEFSNHNGKPFDPHRPINYGVANIICRLVFGHRFEYSDSQFQLIVQVLGEAIVLEASIWAQLFNTFPVLMDWFPGPHQKVVNHWKTAKDFVRTEMEQHKKDRDPKEPRDYIDCYLTEIENNDADTSAGLDEENVVMSAVDLFAAGSETTSTTLRWAFLYMVKYPEVQEKVQAEIGKVIGQSRQPSVMDRAEMPYTDAVLHEIQRMGNIVPLSLPRMTTKDVKIGEHVIPKGIEIFPNLTSVMFDQNEWETPHTFNPQHFLDKDGRFVKRSAFIPFSTGKRACLGENLARMELFLFFTSFLQRFSFTKPAGAKISTEYCLGVTLSPAPYLICAVPRQS